MHSVIVCIHVYLYFKITSVITFIVTLLIHPYTLTHTTKPVPNLPVSHLNSSKSLRYNMNTVSQFNFIFIYFST